MKLISMTDLILNEYKDRMDTPYNDGELVEADSYRWYNYAKFLKQPLKLEHFVPCDDKGNVLEDPELTMRQGNGSVYYGATEEEFERYSKAEEKVLFSSKIDIIKDKYKSINRTFVKLDSTKNLYRKLEYWDGEVTVNYPFLEGKKIEDLIDYDLTLTNSAIKQIGICTTVKTE